MLDIYNASLSAGYFPHKFKNDMVIMIPKDGRSRSVDNFRPISLLEVHGKLLEKIINNSLMFHLEQQNVLKESQHGFQPNRCTGTALAIATETIAKH